ncbi:MAG: DUF1631 family protein [Aquabacterium sp.]|nr:MAG: DUF1631 family protein [Aquabacterium sp.]
MAPPSSPLVLAQQARRAYLDAVLRDIGHTLDTILDRIRQLPGQAADLSVVTKRRELAQQFPGRVPDFQQRIIGLLHEAQSTLKAPTSKRRSGTPDVGRSLDLELVDDSAIEVSIVASRLALAIGDRVSSQFTDLRARLSALEQIGELAPSDILQPQAIAAMVVDAWTESGLDIEQWRLAQSVLQDEIALLTEAAYHETNRWLLGQGVRPEIDLRPFIRRTAGGSSPAFQSTQVGTHGGGSGGARGASGGASSKSSGHTSGGGSPSQTQHAEAVLSRLNQLVTKHLTDMGGLPTGTTPRPASAQLKQAIGQMQAGIAQRFAPNPAGGEGAPSAPAVLQDLQRSKQTLKDAAGSPVERATIEVVALMFQSILTDERVPAALRVWFARLQMPVLRVAVSEPDFFANLDHPARQLIDRMGSCVMGFDAAPTTIGDALEREIKRVVQVVEAYPDTGRRVFQTVLTEFERFLKHYFQSENEASRKGVSLAQQVEQRETLAIQYTIELRKMLNEVPVQEGVREFLFQVWADVLATAGVKFGVSSDQTRSMKRAAADLIWSASAKVSREERAEVIRRLPPLLKTLREGMAQAGMAAEKQEVHIHALNSSLAAAFTARTATISNDRLAQLMSRLETLDDMLPDASDLQLDEAVVLDLSGHESADLEVVGDGGSAPTPAMLQWAKQLQVGSWYQLDYRNRTEPVQLAWQGLRKQLSLFVTPQGRGILFQQQRLAAFLQASLLVPAEDETLTTRATRQALAKLDADPQRLVN